MEPNPWPFSKALAWNLDDLDDRIFKMNKAALVVIDGGVGEGKTTLAVHVVDYINGKHGLPPMDIPSKEQIGLGGVDFAKKLRLGFKKKFPVIVYDEAGDFNKRGALTRFNAMLNRTFETFRAFKILVVLCLPTLNVLDNDLFDKNIPRLGVHCSGRTMKQGHIKGYSNYRMLYIRAKMTKLVVKSFAYGIVEPNFYGHFKDLPADRRRQLDIMSTKGKIRELEKSEVKLEGLVSYNDISTRLVRSVRWIQLAFNDLKIRQVKVIENRKYFDSSVIDILADYDEQKQTAYEPGRKKKEAAPE